MSTTERAADVLAAHQLGDPGGGTANRAWCECSCGSRLETVGGTRDHAMTLGRRHIARALADAGLLAPAPLREITTAEELDALLGGSVISDAHGRTWVLYDRDWSCLERRVGAMFLPHDFLPATVIHVPVDRAEGDGRAVSHE